MPSNREYLDYVMEQLSALDGVSYRAMMGEYVLYYRGKVVGGVYDDRLLLKPTKTALRYMREAVGEPPTEIPYEGAKAMLAADVDDRELTCRVIEAVAEDLAQQGDGKKKKRNPQKGGKAMKKILIVIDMQNDFIDGALGTPEAEGIVEAVKEKIRAYPPEAVIATMDTHGTDYLSTQEGRMLPVEHCIRGTDGWKLRPDIAALLTKAAIYEKPTFGSVRMAEEIRAMQGVEEIEMIGLCTDICVVTNALMLKAFLPEVRICVDAACCAGVTPEKHRAALETMRSCQIEITD